MAMGSFNGKSFISVYKISLAKSVISVGVICTKGIIVHFEDNNSAI